MTVQEMWQAYCHWFQAQEDDERATPAFLRERYGDWIADERTLVAGASVAWWLQLRGRHRAASAWHEWLSGRIPDRLPGSPARHEKLVLGQLPQSLRARLDQARRAVWDSWRQRFPDLDLPAEPPPSKPPRVSRSMRDARRLIREGKVQAAKSRLRLHGDRPDSWQRQAELGVELVDAGHEELGARQIVEALGWFGPRTPREDNLASLADCVRRQRGWTEAARFVRAHQISSDFGSHTLERLGLWALKEGDPRQALALAQTCRGHSRATLLGRIHRALKPADPSARLRMSTLPYLPSERQARWLAPLIEVQLGSRRVDRVLAGLPAEQGLERLEGLLALAEAVPEHWPEAERLASTLEDPYASRWAHTTAARLGLVCPSPFDSESGRDLIEVQAGRGEFEAALRELERVEDEPYRAQAILALLNGMLLRGEVDRAHLLAQQLEPGPSWEEANLALAAARLRRGGAIVDVLETLPTSSQRFVVIISLVCDGRLDSSTATQEALGLCADLHPMNFFLLAEPRLPASVFLSLLPALIERGGHFLGEIGLELGQAGRQGQLRALLKAAPQAPAALPTVLSLPAWLEPERLDEIAAAIMELKYHQA